MVFKTIFSLFVCLLYFGLVDSTGQQIDSIPNGVYTQFKHANGNVSSEGYLLNGKPEGYWKNYFETGTLKSEGSRKNFKLDGSWKFYDL